METFSQAGMDEIGIQSLLEGVFHHEPAVLVDDMDVNNMTATVQLKRKLVTGRPPRVEMPAGEVQPGMKGQEAESGEIFKCNVLHQKNCYGQARIRYKKGNDVMVVFTNRAKDFLVKLSRQVNIDPVYYRKHALDDAFVLLGFQCDEGEPKAPATTNAEGPIQMRGALGEAGRMRSDDWVHYWGRANTAGHGSRIYTTPEGDHVIHPALGKNIYFVEGATQNVLFAQAVAQAYNTHANFGLPGPGDPPVLPAMMLFPFQHWSVNVFVDNAITP